MSAAAILPALMAKTETNSVLLPEDIMVFGNLLPLSADKLSSNGTTTITSMVGSFDKPWAYGYFDRLRVNEIKNDTSLVANSIQANAISTNSIQTTNLSADYINGAPALMTYAASVTLGGEDT